MKCATWKRAKILIVVLLKFLKNWNICRYYWNFLGENGADPIGIKFTTREPYISMQIRLLGRAKAVYLIQNR